MDNNTKQYVFVCEQHKQTDVFKKLAIARSVLYTGIVALWFMYTLDSYKHYKHTRSAYSILHKAATKE